MEEDAGKSLHEGFPDSDRKTYVDFNRSGVPLIEIVTEPDMRSAAEAAEFFEPPARRSSSGSASTTATWKRAACAATPTSRCARPAQTTLGTKAEVKNVNSFRYLQKAIEYEIERQIDVARARRPRRAGDAAVGRRAAAARISMRSKEEAHDYRYFPEPDLPPLVVDAARVDARRARRCRNCPRRGAGGSSRRTRCPDYDAGVLTQSRGAGRLLRGGRARRRGNPKAASNWVMGELLRDAEGARQRRSRRRRSAPAALAGLIALVDTGTISSTIAKDVFEKMYDSGRAADEIVAAEGLAQIDDESRDRSTHRRGRARPPTPTPSRSTAPARRDVRVPRRPGDEGAAAARPTRSCVNELLKRELDDELADRLRTLARRPAY